MINKTRQAAQRLEKLEAESQTRVKWPRYFIQQFDEGINDPNHAQNLRQAKVAAGMGPDEPIDPDLDYHIVYQTIRTRKEAEASRKERNREKRV